MNGLVGYESISGNARPVAEGLDRVGAWAEEHGRQLATAGAR